MFGLDFSGGQAQSQQGTQNKQAGGFDDFFGQPAQPTNTQNQGFGQPAPQTNANTGGGLLDLDFGGGAQPQAQPQTQNQPQAQTPVNQGGFDFMQDQPQASTQQGNQAQAQPQTQAQPAKVILLF